jgi:hypothetical protein
MRRDYRATAPTAMRMGAGSASRFRLGEFDRSIIELELAAGRPDSDPSGAAVLDHLGCARLSAGRREAVVRAWRQALDNLSNESNTAPATSLRRNIAQPSSKHSRSK